MLAKFRAMAFSMKIAVVLVCAQARTAPVAWGEISHEKIMAFPFSFKRCSAFARYLNLIEKVTFFNKSIVEIHVLILIYTPDCGELPHFLQKIP
jgi:hypothetical protein